jgi:hypothetical protein
MFPSGVNTLFPMTNTFFLFRSSDQTNNGSEISDSNAINYFSQFTTIKTLERIGGTIQKQIGL